MRWYASHGYARATIGGRGVLMHRLIAGVGLDDARHVHHVNRDRLDNRRRNLAAVTPADHGAAHRAIHRSTRTTRRAALIATLSDLARRDPLRVRKDVDLARPGVLALTSERRVYRRRARVQQAAACYGPETRIGISSPRPRPASSFTEHRMTSCLSALYEYV